jgi:uncharacterized DUF497 family protein
VSEFEWDENKRKANLEKHGIDFADAVRMFDLPVVEWLDEREDYGESRYIALGELDSQIILCAAFAVRGEYGEVIRMISVRKATKYEIKIYYQEVQRGPIAGR